MLPEIFNQFAESFPEALVLVSWRGEILAFNAQARQSFAIFGGTRSIFELGVQAPERLEEFLRISSTTRQLIVGAITIQLPGRGLIEWRVEACRPSHTSTNLLLRLKEKQLADARFVLLNDQIATLSREIRERIRLAHELAEAHRQLAEYARTLEQKVQERTAELSEANASLEAFCYSIAHDLRAPLRAINGYVELFEAEHGNVLDGSGYLQRIREASERMDGLLLDLLEFARLGHANLPVGKLSLSEELKVVCSEFEPQIRTGKATLAVQEPLPHIRGNPSALHQILRNLISNALRFTRNGVPPHVEISAETDGTLVTVRVRDNGMGISPEHTERIFGLFERLDTTGAGTGVGLAIVKKAVERMGGRLGVESTPGQGSTFWFQIPAP